MNLKTVFDSMLFGACLKILKSVTKATLQLMYDQQLNLLFSSYFNKLIMHAALDFTPNNNYNTNNYKHLMGPKSREEAMGIHD